MPIISKDYKMLAWLNANAPIVSWPAPGLDDTDLSESSLPFELHRA